MPERHFHDMAQAAKTAREHGYSALPRAVAPHGIDSAHDFFTAYFGDQKDDRYTIFSDFIDRTCSRALAPNPARGPLGLITQKSYEPHINGIPHSLDKYRVVTTIPQRTPHAFLLRSLNDTLLVTAHEEVLSLARRYLVDPTSREGELFALWNAWEEIQKQHVAGMLSHFTVIDEGIHTGDQTFVGIPEVIPHVFERQLQRTPSVTDVMATARHSYPLAVDLASGSTSRLAFTQSKILHNEFSVFNPDNFYLTEGAHMRLELKPDVRAEIDASIAGVSGIFGDEHTIGCPAMVNFGHGSAIQRFYTRTLQIMEQHAPIFYPTLSP